MADIKSREKAQCLRRQGKSLNYISEKLDKPKSTVSYWCRDIVLTKEQEAKLSHKSKNAGRDVFIKNAKEKRHKHLELLQKHHDIGINNVAKLSRRDLDMLCIGLYWGEGYKTGNGEFGFTNSDADMIRVYLSWLYQVHDVDKSRIILRVGINESHKSREAKILKYWAGVTNIPKEQFTKTSFIKAKSKKVYSNHNEHYGTLRVKVSGGSSLRSQVMGGICGIVKNLEQYKKYSKQS